MSHGALKVFQRLTPADTDWIFANCQIKTALASTILQREGDRPNTIYIIADGLFEAYIFSALTNEKKAGLLGPGDLIGDTSWLDGEPAPATVRAVESSTVIALEISVLEQKIAQDRQFAARLFRGVATLSAERVRKLTSYIRRSEVGSGPIQQLDGIEGQIIEKVAHFKRLVTAADKRALENSGIVPEEYSKQIVAMFNQLEHATGPEGGADVGKIADLLQAELLPLILLTQSGDRSYSKPRGYAGDYQTIEMAYDDIPRGVGRIGPLLDRCILNLAGTKAVRNRRHLLSTEIALTYDGISDRIVRVMSLACGPAREVFDVLEKIVDKNRLAITCVDIDKEALSLVGTRAVERSLSGEVRCVHANLVYLATGRQELDIPPQDLIYSIGLIDYFADEFVVKLMDWIYERLRPGGRVILGNFHPRNPTKGLMDHVLDWRLIHRDETAMDRLFLNSKFGRICSRILFEEQGINLFAECHKGA
jgi:extracellular factor (EF) 3-hydroxypalmitic acid methyl ester biosynthesis protein